MSKLHILDCTLRDGGYVNNWSFGSKNIKKIIGKLVEAKIDIVECGYLTQKRDFDIDSTMITNMEYINKTLFTKSIYTKFVAMINFGEYNVDDIPIYNGYGIKGLRIAFHKNDLVNALEYCRKIKAKGYDIYIQPMVSLNYTDVEFLQLIEAANEIQPEAFYIVDSFGAMRPTDVQHLLYLTNHNLNENIKLGFHSHNNLQLSYSHAQTLCHHFMNRDLIIDASVMGMGRGAGNLNTELFAEYLNHFFSAKYYITALLEIVDTVLSSVYEKNYWGYSLPYYLSAIHNCHPNYASYLNDKHALTFENINEIFISMDSAKKTSFNKDYIQELYRLYQGKNNQSDNLILQKQLKDKKVMLVAPGKSIFEEYDAIITDLTYEKKTVVAVNFIPEKIETDYVFVSNIRRWENIKNTKQVNFIITSNINIADTEAYVTDYTELLNENELITDNAGLMLIVLLIKCGVSEISLVGFDGYSPNHDNDYVELEMEFKKDISSVMRKNEALSKMLSKYSEQVPVRFVTQPRHIRLIKD